MSKAIEAYNAELKDQGWSLRVRNDVNLYSLRIAKKKNGHPSYSVASKFCEINEI